MSAGKAVPLRYPLLLGTLTLLFALRVVGQLVVALLEPGWLPPFARWYSGLLPYPLLLPIQVAILVVMLKTVRDFARGAGFFVELGPLTGTVLMWLSYVYALSMLLRYAVTMTLHPDCTGSPERSRSRFTSCWQRFSTRWDAIRSGGSRRSERG